MTAFTCNQAMDRHAGPIETGVDDSKPAMLYDMCRTCGYTWAISSLTPERAAAMRRALAAKRAARRGVRS